VIVGGTASAYATVFNTTSFPAVNCTLTMGTDIPATFTSFLTDRSTNGKISGSNPTTSIAGGDYSTWGFQIVPSAEFDPVEVELVFDCLNSEPAGPLPGINTLLLSASAIAPPDIIALSATVTNNGIVEVPGVRQTGFFATASINVGAAGDLTVIPRASKSSLRLEISICETNPLTAACLAPPAPSVSTSIAALGSPTFSIFVKANKAVPLDPAGSRIYLEFLDDQNQVRGSTSVAVKTN